MPVFPVNRDRIFGLDDAVHQLDVVLTGVTAHMGVLENDRRAQHRKIVDKAGNVLFVSGDRRGADNHHVARPDRNLPVRGSRDPRKRSHRLALTAGHNQHDLFVRIVSDLLKRDQQAVRDADIPQLRGGGDDIDHAPAFDRHLAVIFFRRIDDLLHPVDVRRERSDDNPVIRVFHKNIVEGRSDRLFRHRKPRFQGVRTVAEKGQHALFDRKKFKVFEEGDKGKLAVTKFKCISCYGPYSLMKVRIFTGRTHQIRVHMKFIGCPILGDPIYSKTSKDSVIENTPLMLHAYKLKIKIPGSDELKTFVAKVPLRFKKVLKKLHENFSKSDVPQKHKPNGDLIEYKAKKGYGQWQNY